LHEEVPIERIFDEDDMATWTINGVVRRFHQANIESGGRTLTRADGC